MLLRRELASLAAVCAREEQDRYGLTSCVKLRLEEDGYYRCEATDARRLLVVRGPNTDTEGTFPVGLDVFVPAEDWKKVFKLGAGKKVRSPSPFVRAGFEWKEEQVERPGEEGQPPRVQLVKTPVVVFSDVAGTESVRVEQTQEGRYPDVNKVIPTAPPLIKVSIDPAYLAELMKSMQQFTDDESRRVDLLFFGTSPEKARQVPVGAACGSNESGLTVDGLIVPLVDRD